MGERLPVPRAARDRTLSSEPMIPDGLLAAVGVGDESAFALLYDRLAGTILGVALKILRDAANAEEVTRDIFVEVWRTACRYTAEDGGAFEWVMAIAHRHSVQRLRSASSPNDRPEQLANIAQERDVQERTWCGLAALPPLQRESVELAYYHGLTYTEIGDLRDLTPGTAKTLLRDALINLRDHRPNSVHENS